MQINVEYKRRDNTFTNLDKDEEEQHPRYRNN